MKSLTNLMITVLLDKDNVSEHEIDTDIFDNPYLEAVTRAIEAGKNKTQSLVRIRPVASCWDTKNPKTKYAFNSYWAMVNAGLYSKAELLRVKFKAQYDKDLAKEPIHGKLNQK